jgi:signal transduction histidine kinase
VIWCIAALRLGIDAAAYGNSVVAVILPLIPPFVYWIGCVPVILRLGVGMPLRRGRLARAVAVHLVAAGALAALYAEVMVWVLTRAWPVAVPSRMGPIADWGIRFQFGLMSYGFVLAWGYVHEHLTAVRERDIAVARLEAELAQAQLRALKAQLQPHFLFNTLHAVTVLIRRDADAAIRTVMRLSDLLRMTLIDAERQEAPLAHELRFLRLYLEIEQTRFRERLHVVWEVPAELESAAVPTLLLQPLVENAIRHGIEPSAPGGRVTIAAARADGRLVLRVADDGVGFRTGSGTDGDWRVGAGSAAADGGIGLASVQGRLEKLYGGAHRFTLAGRRTGGVEATVEIPYRQFPSTEARDG